MNPDEKIVELFKLRIKIAIMDDMLDTYQSIETKDQQDKAAPHITIQICPIRAMQEDA